MNDKIFNSKAVKNMNTKGRRSSMVTHCVAVVRIRVQILKWKLEFLRHNMFTQLHLGCVRSVIIE